MPFGNINHFLHPKQQTYQTLNEIDNFSTIIANNKCPSFFVNFVMDPKPSYEDPLESYFDESLVERRIDKMLSVDSLGIDENVENFSDYDNNNIKEFTKDISFIDNVYHIGLIFHDNISDVLSNFSIALKGNITKKYYVFV